mgnify:CR=1 FL=1
MDIQSEFDFIKAAEKDIAMLTATRIQVLRAANGLELSVDMSAVEKESRDYYEKALRDGSHAAYLVFDAELFVGAGGISFYRVMPSFHNPSGNKAYIMNMYTHPDYRRRGIASADKRSRAYFTGSHLNGKAFIYKIRLCPDEG